MYTTQPYLAALATTALSVSMIVFIGIELVSGLVAPTL